MARWGRKAKKPWYSEGVPFTCLPGCGRCCDQPGGVVYLTKDDAKRVAEHLKMDVEEWLERDCRRSSDGRWVLSSNKKDGSCIYLQEDRGCGIYPSKPAQCSAFPWWNENMRSDRDWRKTVALCPGLVHPDAEVISLPVIQMHLEADAEAEKGFREWND